MIVLVLVCIVTSAGNNIYGKTMGSTNSMTGYPAFLLYATTLVYTLGFWIMAKRAGQNVWTWTKPQMRQYKLLGLWTALNGVTFQFADTWVDGATQQLIVSLMPVFVLILSYLFLPKFKVSRREWFGSLIVFGGVACGLVPIFRKHGGSSDGQFNKWWWIVAFIASVGFQAMELVQQELAFKQECPTYVTLFWYNLISLGAYVLTIPFEAVKIMNGHNYGLSFGESFRRQGDAFKCFFGQPTKASLLSGDCGAHTFAWVSPVLFILFYIGMFASQALLIKNANAFAAIMVQAAAPPIAAAVFVSPFLVGAVNVTSFSWWMAIGFSFIFVGLLIKGIASHHEPEVSTDYVVLNVDTRNTINQQIFGRGSVSLP